MERGVIPAWATQITRCVDVGGRQLHWADVAWRQGMRGYVIDYWVEPVYSPQQGSLLDADNQKAVESAILTALIELGDSVAFGGYPQADTGEMRNINICLIDAGWMPDPVYEFCTRDLQLYRPTKGFGTGSQRVKYRAPSRQSGRKAVGEHWYATRIAKRKSWLWNLDSDYFKNTIHNAFLTATDQPGSLALFGDEPIKHRGIAEQVCAEMWTREFRPGKGWIEGFIVRSKHNHWLDCLAGAAAGANILGIRIVGTDSQKDGVPGTRKKIKLSEIHAKKHGY